MIERIFAATLACLLIVGCGEATLTRESPPGDDVSDDRPPVPGPSVSDDPAEIASVRKQYEFDLDTLYARGLEQVEKQDWVETECEWAFRERKPDAVAALKRIMNDELGKPDAARARAAHALMRLDDPAGESFLLEALRSPRAPLRAAALDKLGEFDVKTDLTDPRRAKAVLALLDDIDAEVIKQAVSLCGRRKLPGAEAMLLALLRSGRAGDPKEVALQLADVLESPEAAEAVIAAVLRLRPAKYEQRTGFYLGRLVDHPNPKVSGPVRDAFRAYLLGFSGEDRLDQSLVRDLAKVADASCIAALNEIVAKARDPVSRAYAREGLARLDPGHAVEQALDAYRREGAYGAIQILRDHATEKHADRIIAVLLDPGKGPQPNTISLATTRLLLERLGSRGRAAIQKTQDRLEPDARMWALWKLNDLSLDRALDELRAAGVIATDRQAIMSRIEKSRREGYDPAPLDPTDPDSVIEALGAAGLLTTFDAESDQIPCNHHLLLLQFAEGSGGRFKVECPVQVFHQRNKDDFDGPYTVRFLHQGRLYSFGARNNRDWYDVEAVQKALNFALKTAGRKERFLSLESDGQVASFVFADPESFLPVANKYSLPLSDDPDKAMRKGKEFERQVIEQLRK